MSKRETRIARCWMPYYRKLMAKPQRGVISYGGGLDIIQWMRDSEAQGFHVTMTPQGVILR